MQVRIDEVHLELPGVKSPSTGCVWLSQKPGVTVAPAASIIAEMPDASALAASPTDAITPLLTTIVSPAAIGARTSPLTIVPMLRITRSGAHRRPSSPTISETCSPPTRGSGRPPSVTGDRDHQLVVPGRIHDPELDGIEVGADERRVLVVQRDVERGTGTTAFLRRRDDGFASAGRLPQRRTELRVQHRGDVFELTVGPHDAALPVAVDRLAVQMSDRDRGECRRQFHAVGDHLAEVLDEATGERVRQHRCRDTRRIGGSTGCPASIRTSSTIVTIFRMSVGRHLPTADASTGVATVATWS